MNGNNRQLYLNITNVNKTDAGDWTCGDSFNTGTSPTVTLPVYYGPENISFKSTGSSIIVIENESGSVTCSADCNPPCNITWYEGDDTSGSIISSNNGLLSLNNRQQAGNYTCQATNTEIPNSHRSKHLMVIVHYGPENIKFESTNSSITVIENESKNVTCSADCSPPCNINWRKGSVLSGNKGLLPLNNIQRQQAGNYTCQVKNTQIPGSLQSKPLMVIVHYPPTITSLTSDAINNMIDEDYNVTFTCYVDSLPSSVISWSRSQQGGQLYSGSQYTIPKTSRQHTDNYTCTASNHIGQSVSKTIPLNVRYGPENIRFTPTGSSITVIENERKTVTCSADCNPPCNIKWYKDSTIISFTEFLSLINIKRQEAGNYTCQITNTQIPGSLQSKHLMVIVHYPPVITGLTSDATNNMIDEDSTVTFTCSVDSLPSSDISWSRSQPGEQLYSGSQYTIPEVSCQHTDNYNCTASNTIGQPVSKTIPLHVTCSPRENMVTMRNITNRINTTINLEVDIIAYPEPTFTWYHTPTRHIINTARTQQLSTINYKSTVEITLNSTLFGDYIVSVYNGIGVQNFTITVINGEPPQPVNEPVESNNMVTIVVSVLVIVIVVVIVVVIYRRKAQKDSSQDNVPLSNKGNKRQDEMVIDDNLTYEGSDHLFGPRTGAGPGKGQTDNIPMSSNLKTGKDNKMVIDDNLLYEGSDHLFGPQNGNESGKSKKPAKKPDPEVIYTAVVKKKAGQDNKAASGQTGIYENIVIKAKSIPTKKPTINKEGLNYADVVFTNKTPAKDVKPVYHDAVEYACIQPGVRGPTPPPVSDSSDDDDAPAPPPPPPSKPKTKQMKTKKK
ncbi:hemicentin-1-like isoform X2 [Patella vulgata]|uniref:hemicentin-1-like isoform X2 n=1 Tax=Patella vulgata TaxID=6465 RepID=UPI0024A961D5|nr:hemicentin-1-like isoform X2 [Patella vulgata]